LNRISRRSRQAAPARYRTRLRPRASPGSVPVTLATLGLAAMAFAVLQALVIPVLPSIGHRLGVSEDSVTWVLTAYLLSASVATPILGRLGDIAGKKRVLIGTLSALASGTLMAALAPTLAWLVAARIVQGIGGALYPLAFGIIRDELPSDRVPGAIGFVSATLGAGGGIGILLAGPIIAHLDYHWLFWIPLPVIALGGAATWWYIPESGVRAPGHVNWGTAVLLSGWLVVLLLGVTLAPGWGWASPALGGLFLAAAGLFAWWWLADLRSRVPLVDIRTLIRPAVWRTNVVALCIGFILYASVALIPQLLQTPRSSGYGFGATVTESGLFLLPQTVIIIIVGLSAGRIAATVGSARAVLAGSVLAVGAFAVLSVAHDRSWQLLTASVLLGAAIGLTFAGLPNLIIQAVPAEQTGVATGVNANLRTVGGALGGQITASIVSTGALFRGYPRERGFTVAFVVLMAVAAAAAAVAALVPDRPRSAAGDVVLGRPGRGIAARPRSRFRVRRQRTDQRAAGRLPPPVDEQRPRS
jgi:MFS family permease